MAAMNVSRQFCFHRLGVSAIVVTASLAVAGCGPGYPPVSGRVTIAGRPAAGVQVLFTPLATGATVAPGPYAQATTDADGRYSLVTRRGIPGATPGRNRVELKAAAWNELEYLRSDAARLRAEAGGNGQHPAHRQRIALDERINRLEAEAGNDGLEPSAVSEYMVPAEGTNSADFDLATLASESSPRRTP
jgi:hypothetical protein